MEIIEEMPSTLDSVIFHEMCHAFHGLAEKSKSNSVEAINSAYKEVRHIDQLWTNDEEFYNITGYFYENGKFKFDPINCNMYEICKACEVSDSRDKISQRIFHTCYFDIEKRYKKEIFLGHKENIFIDLSTWVLDKE